LIPASNSVKGILKLIKDTINKSEIIQKITPIIEKVVEDSELSLVEINFCQESGNWRLKIFIYNPKKAITLEDCEIVTKKIAPLLDEIIPVHYRLEVSSPGTERKLKAEKEYEIFKGKRVKIKLKKTPEKEALIISAKITDYTEDDGLILELPEKNEVLKIKKQEITYVKLESEYKI